MRAYEDEGMVWMSFSRTGDRADEQPHSFLDMGSRHAERMCATGMLLYFWEKHPDAKVYLNGQEFHPTDEEFAEAQESSASVTPSVPVVNESTPEALVSASVAIEQTLHDEDEPRRESLREVAARARKRRGKVKPCKSSGGLRAMMRASQS